MKNKYMIKVTTFALAFAMGGMLFTSCDDDIKINNIDETNYEVSADILGYLTDNQGKKNQDVVEFRNSGDATIFVGTTKEVVSATNVSLTYDATVLDEYNQTKGSDYVLFPEANVTISGDAEIIKGTNKSSGVSIAFTTSDELSPDVTYAIPLRASSDGVKLSGADGQFVVLVKDLTAIPDASKASGIKVFSCMEINDTNPLNNLCFTLKNSKKPLVDALIMFSANINYSEENGKVYISQNPNVKHLLDNRMKYLKPLQDRGIKIILGLLGNHDRSGIANLSEETAKKFAQEVKATLEAYHLDGIFIDDEYSSYMTPPPPGFVSPSSAGAARLCYEVKQAMPECIVVSYAYSTTSSLPAIDGQESGTFVDYGLHDYGGSYDLSSNYPGMPKSNMGLYSQEFARGRWASKSSLEKMRADGYGSHMIFAMDPFRSNFSRQLSSMEDIAEAFYDDELVYDGQPYSKDW